MKIYLDLLLLQDTIMMSLILFILQKIIKLKIGIVRVLTVSLMSSLLSILILIFFPPLFDNVLIKLLLSFLIVKYGLKVHDNADAVQRDILFWSITFLIGGTNIFFHGNIIQMLVALCMMIISIIVQKSKVRKQMLLESATCFITFDYCGKQYRYKALIDTGHDVKSIYGEEVIFVKDHFLEEGRGSRKRLVSYQTISGKETKIGIKINRIQITYGGKKGERSAIVVTAPNRIQNYDAIVSFEFIEGGMTNGDIITDETKGQETFS